MAEHPFGGSWGYQVTSYYAPTARFGTPDDFRYLVDRLHQAGIGVIVDWVPGALPEGRLGAGPLRRHPAVRARRPAPRRAAGLGHLVFDFGRREVRNFLVANALYWLEEFHIDGLRVDAVASMLYLDYSRAEGEWLPNQYGGRENLDAVAFLQEMNATVYQRVPGVVTIAEESTAWPGVTRPTHLGGLGFGFKWNMGWMHDTLGYIARDPIYRQYHHHQMTFSMMYAFTENFVLPLSHDEVVHGKGSLLRQDARRPLAARRPTCARCSAYMWAHPGKQLLFMGGEFGQGAEWSEARSLDWWLLDDPLHSGRAAAGRRPQPGLPGQPGAVDAGHHARRASPGSTPTTRAGNTFSFLRWGADGSVLACVANFAGGPHEGYRLGLPRAGRWQEVLNTDAEVYGGSGVGNLGAVEARPEPWHGQPASATLRVPPLGALWLRYTGERD